MLEAYAYREERDADKIAYAVAIAWGAKKRPRAGAPGDAAADREHLRNLVRGEGDGTPIRLDERAVETIFAGDLVEHNRPYVPPPATAPEVDVEADKKYLRELDRVFREYQKAQEKGGEN